MNPQYRFFLKIGSTRRQAYPIYGDDLSKNYSQESGQMFFRTKLEGKLKFTKADFDFIMSSAFDDTVYVDLEMYDNSSNTWAEYFKGRFMRTDCIIVPDDMMLEVSLTPDDPYEIVLSGLEKEFNLIELAPEIQHVNVAKRPAIQIYIDGESVLTTFVGCTYFEQQVTPVNVSQGVGNIGGVLTDMGFRFQKTLDTVTVRASSKGNSAANGNYVNFGYDSTDITLNKVGGGNYRFRWYGAPGQQFDEQTIAELIYVPTGEVVGVIESEKYGSGQLFLPNTEYMMTASKSSGDVLYYWSFTETYIYARLLHDKDSIDGIEVYDLTSNDIADNNANYKKASPVNIDGGLEFSLYFSNTPTEWGQYQPGVYFTRPVDYSREPFYPIGRSSWIDTSLWFAPTLYNELYDNKAKEDYTLKHAYTLESSISVLLQQLTRDVYFVDSSSRFFSQDSRYNYVNPVSRLAFRTLITQKTNILKGEYDQPAQKAMITLKQIFDMLRDCFQCYWFITTEDDGYELHVEHISYFINGLRYPGWDGTAAVSKDLTQLKHPRSGKPWSYGISEYSFEKEDMPEWYQFDWSDDVSFPFKGYPIEILSGYVKKGNVENVSVNKFVSDIDLMLLNPSAFSEDGMVLLIATASGDTLSLPFVSRTVDGITYTLQNGYAAFCDLQERYYLRSMPASKVIINKTQRTVVPTRGKKQEVEFPVGTVDPNIYELVKTSLGNGQIKDMKINLSSRLAKVTLMHDTEK